MRSKQIQPSSNGGASLRPASRPRRAKPGNTIAKRPRIESFLLALSADFVKAPADDVDRTIDVWLERLAAFLEVDKIGLWERDVDGTTVHRQHFYSVPGLQSVPSDAAGNDFPWLDEQYRLGRVVNWARIPEDIPAAASAERMEAIRVGAKSVLGIPNHAGGTVCILTFACVRTQRTWPKNLIRKLQLVAEIFSSAFVRQRTERSLLASESRNRAILRALPDLIFVLSPEEVF